MNNIRISTLLRFLGLVLLAVCFNAGHASAQMFQGKFTLPFEAHWGQATLPAGEYTFRVDGGCATCTLRLVRDNRTVAMIMAWGQDEKYSGPTNLTVVRGKVRSLSIPEIGVVFYYGSPQLKHLTAPEERELARTVAVTPSHS
jgi:hypothetical protein